MHRFRNKVVIVQAPPRESARQRRDVFSHEGAAVVFADIADSRLRRVAADMPRDRTLLRVTDVTKYKQVEALIEGTLKKFGRLHVLVNQAEAEAKEGRPVVMEGEHHGLSVLFRLDEDLFHTYSVYARACSSLSNAYSLLDTMPYGRQQDFEDSPSRLASEADGWIGRVTSTLICVVEPCEKKTEKYMFKNTKAFSGFSVNDLAAAKSFTAKPLGWK